MELRLKRIFKGNEYTIGQLFIDGKYFCDTLEDVVRPNLTAATKVKGRTAIPEGTYLVQLTFSPRFNKVLPLLCDVPLFSGIRIHAGNTAADTEGCILVGYNKAKGKVLDSRATMSRLMSVLGATRQRINITVG